jgi:hypothetical protein
MASESSEITQFWATTVIKHWALTYCMNINCVIGHEQASKQASKQSFVLAWHINSVSTDNILMWTCEV